MSINDKATFYYRKECGFTGLEGVVVGNLSFQLTENNNWKDFNQKINKAIPADLTQEMKTYTAKQKNNKNDPELAALLSKINTSLDKIFRS